MQEAVKKQWWSLFRTHTLQILQWKDLGGAGVWQGRHWCHPFGDSPPAVGNAISPVTSDRQIMVHLVCVVHLKSRVLRPTIIPIKGHLSHNKNSKTLQFECSVCVQFTEFWDQIKDDQISKAAEHVYKYCHTPFISTFDAGREVPIMIMQLQFVSQCGPLFRLCSDTTSRRHLLVQ